MNDAQTLTIKLLQRAIVSENADDQVLRDFADTVIPKLAIELAGCTAKGGIWVERKRREMLAAGQPMKSERALGDQSITAHLLNGLFPVATIIRKLRQIDTSVARYLDETCYRLFVAGYLLHDWEKFPGIEEKLKAQLNAGFKPDFLKHREFVEPLLKDWIVRLGINDFLKAGRLNPDDQIDTLAYLAHNTQEKYETHRPTVGFKLTVSDRACELIARLTRLADLLSSEVKRPADVLAENLRNLLYQLSNGHYKFTFHAVSENRGILTNVINNALLDLYRAAGYHPLLYFPNGVVYLATEDAGYVDSSSVPRTVVEKIRKLCASQIERRLVGLQRARNGTGLKFASYYWLFFSPEDLILKVGPKAALERIKGTEAKAPERAEKLRKIQSEVSELPGITFSFPNDLNIDRLAEFCHFIERKVWAEFLERYLSKGAYSFDVTDELFQLLRVQDLRQTFDLLSRPEIMHAAGGVPLGWYYIAAEYLKRNPGLGDDDFPGLLHALAHKIAEKIGGLFKDATAVDGWQDLTDYVFSVISNSTEQEADQKQILNKFKRELDRYITFKKSRSGFRPCSLCSTAFKTQKQEEAGVLSQPQVYTNKHIFLGDPKRSICPICSLEMMLRQILMDRTGQSGANFESAMYRYLYLYPTYYFTAETVRFLRSAYTNFHRTNFRTDIKDYLINRDTGEVDFSLARFQSLAAFLISEEPLQSVNSVLKVDYPEDDPITFFFVAIPHPPKKKKEEMTDTESWIMPAFLTLLFPLLFDVKVVASEAAVPIYISGADFEETVLFDTPHDFVAHLLSLNKDREASTRIRLRLDETPRWLSTFIATYTIHLDANARQSGAEYDAKWGRLAELARNLSETMLYVFHYLNVWLRRQGKESPPPNKIRLYGELYKVIDPKEEAMNHPRKLVELYRRFYRAKRSWAKANAILKPIDVAADALRKADRDVFADAYVDLVAAAVMSLMQRVHNKQAEGRPAYAFVEGKWKGLTPEEERQAVRSFAEYFVKEVFEESLRGDRARLTGIQLNLLRDTCEFIYRQTEDEERRKRDVEAPEEIDEVEGSTSASN